MTTRVMPSLARCLAIATASLQTFCGPFPDYPKLFPGMLLLVDPATNHSTCIQHLVGGALQGCPPNLQGVVTTLVGPAPGGAFSGDSDGTGSIARFFGPTEMATDGVNLYVADARNNKIRKVVISSGVVTTIAGPAEGSTATGDADGTGGTARFNNPTGITTDGVNLYVADSLNNKIRKIVIASGVVTTVAGPAPGSTTPGDTDAIGNAARFNDPFGITTDGTNLFVSDTLNNKIRKIAMTGDVTTIAGPAQGITTGGAIDSTGNAARFSVPEGIATDGINLYIADFQNQKIRQVVISSAVTTTVAGSGVQGDADGTGAAAQFFFPRGIVTDGTSLYIGDAVNNKIRKIVISSGVVTTFAGPAPGIRPFGDTDATGNAARFQGPYGIATDGESLLVADTDNNKIRRIR
ncbi:MAG: hypothetical protein K8S54_14020 [Spirochaetia bacterium]|nr:hypothetical protein [Spirochaetia bacterium]